MITATLILLGASLALVSAHKRRSPMSVIVRWLLHAQAAWVWATRYAWPALRQAREHYAYCLDEARRATR